MRAIVCTRPDGLGTRLLAILFARLLAEQLSVQLYVCWPSLNDPNYTNVDNLLERGKHSEIFGKDNVFADGSSDFGQIVDIEHFSSLRTLRYSAIRDNLVSTTRAAFIELAMNFDVMIFDMPYEAVFQCEEAVGRERINSLWQLVNLNDKVRIALSRLGDTVDFRSAAAIHVRRGDIVNILLKSNLDYLLVSGITVVFQRFLPLAPIIRAVDGLSTSCTHFIVCSEDPSCARFLETNLTGKHIVSTAGIFKSGSNEAAILDLLVLSKAKVLLSPFQSFFSECAAAIGVCEYRKLGLDVYDLVFDLINLIDEYAPSDAQTRRAIVYATGWANLWNEGDSEGRQHLLELAKINNFDVVNRIISPQR